MSNKIDDLLSSKPSDLSNAITYPTCAFCGKHFGFYSAKNLLPEKYRQFCINCAIKQVEQDIRASDKITRDALLLEIFEKIEKNRIFKFLPDDLYNEAAELYKLEQDKRAHQKYIDEVKNLYKQAYENSLKSGESSDIEFYALLLQRIDNNIDKNSYKSDPRNIVFNV